MNILVIGNGFDLAHGLPTKYTDFLLFCNIILNIIEESHIGYLVPRNEKDYKNWIEKNNKIPLADGDTIIKIGIALCSGEMTDRDKEICMNMINDFFLSNFSKESNNPQLVKELFYIIYNNNWIEYFLKCNMYGKENWINFESEISKVIQIINKGINENDPEDVYSNILYLGNKFFNDKFTNNVPEYLRTSAEEQKKIEKPEISYKELRDILLADLNKLIRAFEIYLCEYVEEIEIQKKLPDIKELKINHVLSFNYTNTYENQYDNSKNIEYDYIHGKADVNNTIETNNMVLGIDEYLKDNRKNKDIEFIAFKKYYQRIYKGTGCKYKNWVDNIWEEKKEYELSGNRYPLQIPFNQFPEEHRHYSYFFGHSLDVTDKDILRDLILNDNVYTTIFYHNKDAMGQQIANLVKVIGQDELIRRTGGNTKTIEFKLQQNMIPIENKRHL